MLINFERNAMSPSRLRMYLCIAIVAAGIALYLLAQEPDPVWPINLIHLLFQH